MILAGLDYDTPWTRDAAINVWNGAGLLLPDVARATLLSVLERAGETVRIGGQYWDAIIWTIGAWHHYLYTGDRELLDRYQRWRSLDSLMVAMATDSLTRIYGVPGRAASAVRRLGMALVGRIGPLRSRLMSEARGTSGDLPLLLRGLPI